MKKEVLIKRLSEKRFWVILSSLIASNLIILNIDEETISNVLGIVGNIGLMVTYLLLGDGSVGNPEEFNKEETVDSKETKGELEDEN